MSGRQTTHYVGDACEGGHAEARMSEPIVNRFITFTRTEANNAHIKTQVWEVTNNRSGDLLGQISWYTGWRQYCFFPEWGATFNESCLSEIAKVCRDLTAEQRLQYALDGRRA